MKNDLDTAWLHLKIHEKIEEVMNKLDFHSGYSIEYRRMGRAAAKYSRKTNTLIFDPVYLKNHTEHYLNVTVPHEVCHLVQWLKYNEEKAHGPVWNHLMRKLGLPTNYCTKAYDTVLSRNYKTTDYKCSCQIWKFTKKRINKDNDYQAKLERLGKPLRPLYRCPTCHMHITPLVTAEMEFGKEIPLDVEVS